MRPSTRPGAPVTVTLCRDGAQATVTVVNEAAPSGPPPGPSGGSGGYGLVRLDERVRQAGGTLYAQPTGGGFTVAARLPLAAGARATPPGGTRVRPRETAVARRTALRRMIYTVWLPAAAAVVLLLVMIFYESHLARDTVLDEQVHSSCASVSGSRRWNSGLPAHQARPERRPAVRPAPTSAASIGRAWTSRRPRTGCASPTAAVAQGQGHGRLRRVTSTPAVLDTPRVSYLR